MDYDSALDFQNSVSRDIARFHLERLGKTYTDSDVDEWLHTVNIALPRDVKESIVEEYWAWYLDYEHPRRSYH